MDKKSPKTVYLREHLAYQISNMIGSLGLSSHTSSQSVAECLKKRGTCASTGPLPHNEIATCSTNLLLLRYLNGLAFHCCVKNNKHQTEIGDHSKTTAITSPTSFTLGLPCFFSPGHIDAFPIRPIEQSSLIYIHSWYE